MAMQVGGSDRGTIVELNVVPLIDILLVLLVIFMIMPHHQQGLDASIPQPATDVVAPPQPETVVVQVSADGSLRINQQPVDWDQLQSRMEAVFKERAHKVAFIRGESPVEFALVARVVDVLNGSGISVGLLTPGLEQKR